MNQLNSKAIILHFLLYISCSIYCFAQQTEFDTTKKYPVEELKSDLNYLIQKFEKRHPNLYLYTPENEMTTLFDSIRNSINQPLTEREFYNLISILNSKIKDGHSMILPSIAATEYYNSNCSFLPFYFYITANSIRVTMNCSSNSLIKEGSAILSINGKPTEILLSELIKRSVRDGENNTYPFWILTNYFKEYYSFSYGHPASYQIKFIDAEKGEQTVSIDALKKDSIKYYKNLRYTFSESKSDIGKGILLYINDTISTAVLTIKSFDRQILKEKYGQQFSKTINKAFEQIKNKKAENLIVDLRNNQGGDFEPGRELLSYLVKEPIIYLEGSSQQRTINPAKNAFQNKVYILINGGSFSNSGIVSSYLAISKRAVFYGEETAGNSTILSGEPIDIVLPKTGLYCQISTQSYHISKDKRDAHGVQPDFLIQPTIESIITGKDEILEAVIAKINTELKK